MSASLCGGLGAGPIATGQGTGNSLTLTLDRDVTCGGVIYVVAGAYSGPGLASGDSPDLTAATDSVGGTWLTYWSDFGVGEVGNIRQDRITGGPPVPPGTYETLFFSGSALRTIAAGEMHAGDTIDLTFVSSYPGDCVTIAMAFVFTGIGVNAVAMTGLGVQYGESYSFPDEGPPSGNETDTDLTYALADFGPIPTPVADCAVLAISHALSTSGDYTPAEGVLLGQHDNGSNLTLAFSLIPGIAAASTHEPGGSWSSPYELAVGNWQFVEFEPTGPTLHGHFRVT